MDLLLLAAALSLIGLGVVMVYSSSAVFAASRYKDSMFFFKRDLVYACVGLVALYIGARIDYRLYQRFTYPLLLGVTALLVMLMIPGLGTRVDGAVRWFRIAGVSFQPSEAAKFALVVYLAYSLAKKRSEMRTFSIGFLPHLIVASLVSALVLRQPDLGSAAILMSVTMLLLLVAGTKLSYVLLAALAATPLAYQQIVGTPWRLRRLLAFLDPWAHRRDAGYQMAESLITVGSGGVSGLGLGDGRQKLFFLPAAHTDFIFAIIGEELGLVGLVAVVGVYGLLVLRGLRAAHGARELFGTYLAYGLTTMFGLQALLHMAVVLGLVPTKGITLPLVSYGGTALVASSFCVGVLLNISMRKPAPVPAVATRARRDSETNNKRKVRRVLVAGADGADA
ncbi:MAG: putative lipid II flippase FtsW [Myxococcales bacterium]|nr:putative lipid II flippase FtsW [Myxococcales bacterium]